MYIILFLLLGLGVGILARWIVPGDVGGGWITSMMFGVFGALFGGLLGRLVGLYGQDQSGGLFMSALGAVLLVGGYHALARHRPLRERYR